MSLRYLLSTVICQTFIKECGKFQIKNNSPKAFFIGFKSLLEGGFAEEEGYRYIDLLIYAPMNYVYVGHRKRWNVISTKDLDYNDEGDSWPLPGKDYTKGESEWVRLVYHDSGWYSDGIERFLKMFGDKITAFDSSGPFWRLIDPPQIKYDE